jgi:large subunit ribosomal protein L3
MKTRKYQFMKEVKIADDATFNKGDQVTVESFKDTKLVEVMSVSKGKGFQGVVKRYHFRGGPETHGSHAHREPGSIGCRAKPGRVVKGKKLPGHMGSGQVTLKKIPVKYIDVEKNLIGLKGPVPGANKSLIFIQA